MIRYMILVLRDPLHIFNILTEHQCWMDDFGLELDWGTIAWSPIYRCFLDIKSWITVKKISWYHTLFFFKNILIAVALICKLLNFNSPSGALDLTVRGRLIKKGSALHHVKYFITQKQLDKIFNCHRSALIE